MLSDQIAQQRYFGDMRLPLVTVLCVLVACGLGGKVIMSVDVVWRRLLLCEA